jgi:hypothetical protein
MFDYKESVNLKEGVNEVTPHIMFQYDQGQYGDQVYFEFSAGDMSIKHWVGLPSPKRDDGTDNEYYKSQLNSFAQTLGQFVTGFYPLEKKAAVKEKISEAAKKSGDDLKLYCDELKKLLPENWNARDAQLLLHYKNDTTKYLSIPKWAVYNNGVVFTACEGREIEVSDYFRDKYMGLKKATVTTSGPATPAVSEDDWS